MLLDRSFVEHNRIETERMRKLIERLTDEELKRPLGEHWTIAVAFAHLAFWDERVIAILDATGHAGKVVIQTIDIVVNDISLPLWLAIPPRLAAGFAIATAEKLDHRLEIFPTDMLEEIAAINIRFVRRDFHRSEHLNEIEAALR